MSNLKASMISFRLGGTDGVSIEAAKWQLALEELGFEVSTVAGSGPVDHLIVGLGIDSRRVPDRNDLEHAIGDPDLVVVENLCSLPLNPNAASVVAQILRGRRTVMHHHDLPWQRARFASYPPPPDDPQWRHVTINQLSQTELADHGISATTIYNCFDTDPPSGNRQSTRVGLGVSPRQLLILQPTRALDRKNVRGGLTLAERLGGVYWLLGPAEDGYDDQLESILGSASVPVIHGYGPGGEGHNIADAYAASDLVTLPSFWEGFGNPSIESALYRKPLAIGPYPVAAELASFGFEWFALDDHARLADWLKQGDRRIIDHNFKVAKENFDLSLLPNRLYALLHGTGWLS